MAEIFENINWGWIAKQPSLRDKREKGGQTRFCRIFLETVAVFKIILICLLIVV